MFKPDQRVYRLASEMLDIAPAAIAFQAANAWDAAGTASAGLTVNWINRSGTPDEYGLRGAVNRSYRG